MVFLWRPFSNAVFRQTVFAVHSRKISPSHETIRGVVHKKGLRPREVPKANRRSRGAPKAKVRLRLAPPARHPAYNAVHPNEARLGRRRTGPTRDALLRGRVENRSQKGIRYLDKSRWLAPQ